MRIVVLTNFYPPHHGGSFDLRCQTVTEALQKRGHAVRVLTSSHGIGVEQRDEEIERRLALNGVAEHPAVTAFGPLRELETRNHAVVRETFAEFQPEVVHVWSLHGLSKSLLYTLRESRVPAVFDVSDQWIASEIRQDPWLRWWNQPKPSLAAGLQRAALERTGQRTAIDAEAPTRISPGLDRIPELFGPDETVAAVEPESIASVRFDRLYFSSYALRLKTQQAGFQVGHGEVIYPGIRAEQFAGVIRPMAAPVKRFLIVTNLTPDSGVMTALQALRLARQNGVRASVSIYGRGESEVIAQLRSFVVTQQLPVEFLTVSNLNRDMAQIYRDHDAFLFTSESEAPGATSLLEAMASGLPLIASNTGVIQEWVTQGETAFVYPPGDAPRLAARIQEMQMQPALRCQMAETAQAMALTHFNESTVIDRVEGYLEASRQMWA